jgi:hypothetical protein
MLMGHRMILMKTKLAMLWPSGFELPQLPNNKEKKSNPVQVLGKETAENNSRFFYQLVWTCPKNLLMYQ